MTFIETSRLLFRTHESRDEDAFVAIHGDAEMRRYVGGTPWTSRRARERFRAQFLGKPVDEYGMWATVLKAEDRYIGHCGFHGSRAAAALAYYIARPYWGRGFATEAAAAFVEAGRTRLHLERIHATVERGHLASERILRKLGFTFVRDEPLPGSARVISHYVMQTAEQRPAAPAR